MLGGALTALFKTSTTAASLTAVGHTSRIRSAVADFRRRRTHSFRLLLSLQSLRLLPQSSLLLSRLRSPPVSSRLEPVSIPCASSSRISADVSHVDNSATSAGSIWSLSCSSTASAAQPLQAVYRSSPVIFFIVGNLDGNVRRSLRVFDPSLIDVDVVHQSY